MLFSFSQKIIHIISTPSKEQPPNHDDHANPPQRRG